MIVGIIGHQCLFALRQKKAIVTFYILLGLVLLNYVINMFEFQGTDLVEMYHPARLLLLSFNRTYDSADGALLFVQLYPVLVVLPSGFMLLSEKNRKEDVLIIERVGASRYYWCGMASAFIVTAAVFTVPFLLELLLNCVSFPIAATGDFWGDNLYDPTYIGMTRQYLFSGIYAWNPYVYAVAGILFFGIFSGILGMFTAALSVVLDIRYKILLFLPVFILLNIHPYVSKSMKPAFSIRWFDYVMLFDDLQKSDVLVIGFLLSLLVVSISCIGVKTRGDLL